VHHVHSVDKKKQEAVLERPRHGHATSPEKNPDLTHEPMDVDADGKPIVWASLSATFMGVAGRFAPCWQALTDDQGNARHEPHPTFRLASPMINGVCVDTRTTSWKGAGPQGRKSLLTGAQVMALVKRHERPMRKLMALAITNPMFDGVSKDGFYLGTKDGPTTARADGQLKSGRGEKDFDDHTRAHHCEVAAQLPQHAPAEAEQSSSSEPMEAEAECGNEFTEAALAVTRPSTSPGKAMEGVPPTCQPEGAAWIIFCTFGPRRQQRRGLEPSRIVMGGAAPSGSALSALQLKKIASETGDRGATQAGQHRQKNVQLQEDGLAEARLERQALVTLESTKAALELLQGEMAGLMQQRAQELQVATDPNFPQELRDAAMAQLARTAGERARLRLAVAQLRTQLAELKCDAPDAKI
jgi:hypothetical protein